MQLQIAICDDIPQHSEHLAGMLAASGLVRDATVSTFETAQSLLAAMCGGAAFDILFLDVELGSENGIHLAQQINEKQPFVQIIFVTANLVNAIDVDEAKHVYFLTKPVDAEKLRRALERALQPIATRADKRIRVALHGAAEAFFSAGQILYCERIKRTTTLLCVDGAHYTSEKLDYFEAALPERMFARPHNSFLVNLLHVRSIERFCVHMDNGMVLPVSNQRRIGFRKAMAAFVSTT